MTQNNKIEPNFEMEFDDNDDFSSETFIEEWSTAAEEIEKEEVSNQDDINDSSSAEIEEYNPFEMESEDIEDFSDINEPTPVESSSVKKWFKVSKKIIIISWAFLLWIILIIIISVILSSSPKSNIKTSAVSQSLWDEVIEDVPEQEFENMNENNLQDENEFWTNEFEEEIPTQTLNSIDDEAVEENKDNSENTISVKNNSADEVIDITEAVLSPTSVKISINNNGEFDGIEDSDGEDSFIKIKENTLVIPTVSKSNFVPDVSITVNNTQTEFKATDLIKVDFDVYLNSKTLSYTLSKKIYKDKDYIVDLSLNTINSDIVSIEENLIHEELTVPIALMNSWEHTIWFKLNNYPIEKYTFYIK